MGIQGHPGFRWADIAVLIAMLVVPAFFAIHNIGQVWRDAALPTAPIVIYAVWSWRR